MAFERGSHRALQRKRGGLDEVEAVTMLGFKPKVTVDHAASISRSLNL